MNEDSDSEDLYEDISYRKLVKFIGKSHPIDRRSNKPFKINDSITVKNFYSKLYDLCNIIKLKEALKYPLKLIRIYVGGQIDKNSKYVKPESMEYLPDSDSDSEKTDDGGLSEAA
jgi:hypothetical protein